MNQTPTPLKTHFALYQGENRVITANAAILAGIPRRSTLADDDIAGDHDLTPKFLHAESLALAVASVLD